MIKKTERVKKMSNSKSKQQHKFRLFGILFTKRKDNIYLKFAKPIKSSEVSDMIPKKWMVSTKPLPKFSVVSLGIPPEIDPPFSSLKTFRL